MLKSISGATDLFMILIYPYDADLYFVVYQSFDGRCVRVDLENIKDEKERETVYP